MPELNDEQSRRWSGAAGHAWVDAQAVLDQTYKSLEELLVDAASVVAPLAAVDAIYAAADSPLPSYYREWAS